MRDHYDKIPASLGAEVEKFNKSGFGTIEQTNKLLVYLIYIVHSYMGGSRDYEAFAKDLLGDSAKYY